MAVPSIYAPADREVVVTVDKDMVEITLLLPTSQAAALERAARQGGLTVAQLARRLVRDFLHLVPLTLPMDGDCSGSVADNGLR